MRRCERSKKGSRIAWPVELIPRTSRFDEGGSMRNADWKTGRRPVLPVGAVRLALRPGNACGGVTTFGAPGRHDVPMMVIALFLALLAAAAIPGGFYFAHLTLTGEPTGSVRAGRLRCPSASPALLDDGPASTPVGRRYRFGQPPSRSPASPWGSDASFRRGRR